MSNLGFHRAMRELGIETVVTDVGDRYVLAGMREHAAVLGGEQSGHVIALDRQTTGDGLITAVLLLDALGRHHEPLAEAATIVRRFPQVLINVRADRTRLAGCDAGLGGRRARERAARGRRTPGASSCAPPAPSRSCG